MKKIGGNITAFLQLKTGTVRNEIGEVVPQWTTLHTITGFLYLSAGDSKYVTYDAKIQESTHIFICDYLALDNRIKAENSRLMLNGKAYVFAAFEWIKEKISTALNSVKTVIKTVWNAIKNFLSSILNGIKTVVFNVFNGIKSTISNILNGIKSAVSTAFNAVKTGIETPINKAKSIVQNGLNAIKGFFDKLKLKFPNIKLPHFSIDGEFSLSPPSVPKLSIDWYAKAMNNAMLLNSPTIFGMNPNGSLLGGGEAGQEVVSGSTTLMNMIRSAVHSENSGVAYYLEKLISMLAEYFPELITNLEKEIILDDGTLVGKLAPKMDNKLGDINKLRARGK